MNGISEAAYRQVKVHVLAILCACAVFLTFALSVYLLTEAGS